ncbi:unnamed protein product [Staurois parvus]|uniref:Uncharacterized protein n=1 Tax=Staurois parvus TaxID=386267 RepID=A0ABN9CTK0_9NEOB|nr:unnamed protein product [Staurois parvus]
MPHISAHLSRLSMSPISASQCRLSVPYISVMYQCCLSVPISDACQCPSVQPTSASSSVPITAASLAHISEGEKSLIYKIV